MRSVRSSIGARVAGICLLSSCWLGPLQAQQWRLTELAPMPEPATNQAVVEGFVNDTPFVYSFGGLDTSKVFSGMHLRSYRYNTFTDQWQAIPDLPDTLGKVAASASRIGDTIYIIGGYHVFADGSEKSSARVHRYHIPTNTFLPDGAPIPVPIDDQVQAVYRDSLIYVVTGWSEDRNVSNVQVYDPRLDTWLVGTSVPNTNLYRSFGATGTIWRDTLWYFGGAAFGFSFPIQNLLRWGVIDPVDPLQITWSDTVLDPLIVGYRMACTPVYGDLHWLGGSTTTYNYNGIAYNGSGPVEPISRDLWLDRYNRELWVKETGLNLPMDLRGLASVNDTLKYIAGGMEPGQQVSDKLIRLERINHPTGFTEVQREERPIRIYPNPTRDWLHVVIPEFSGDRVEARIVNVSGQVVRTEILHARESKLNVGDLPVGYYVLHIMDSHTAYRAQRILIR